MLLFGIDLETTGLDPQQHHVIEVGAVLWDTDTQAPISCVSTLIHNDDEGFSIPDDITALTGITEAMTQCANILPAVMLRLQSMVDQAHYAVAHNAEFERSFIGDLGKCWLDTMTDIPYPPMKGKGGLNEIAMMHNVFNPFPHRALFDAVAMMQILSKYDLDAVIARSKEPNMVMIADVSFDQKDLAKNLGYRWNRSYAERQWSLVVKASEVDDQSIKANQAGFGVTWHPYENVCPQTQS